MKSQTDFYSISIHYNSLGFFFMCPVRQIASEENRRESTKRLRFKSIIDEMWIDCFI